MSSLYACPVEYLFPMFLLVDDHGGDGSRLLEEANVTLDNGNKQFVTVDELQRIVKTTIKLTNRPDVGLLLANLLNIGKHGQLGYAAMSSPDIRTAIKQSFQYKELRTSSVSAIFRETNQYGIIEIDSETGDPILYRYLAEVGVYCCFDAVRFCLGGSARGFRFEFSYPEPDYTSQYHSLFPGEVDFNASHNRIIFPREILDFPISSSDAPLASIIEEQCRSLLAEQKADQSTSLKVRNLLLSSKDGFPSQQEIAEHFHMHPRTLRTKLSNENTNYRQILEDVRHQLALKYLSNSNLKIEQISYLLNYNEPTHFIRAFKRWQGQTPNAYRQSN